MIVHIVLVKLNCDDDSKDIREFYDGLDLLKSIDGVIDIWYGNQDSMYQGYLERNKGYTHAFAVLFDSKNSLQNYDSHPLHIEFKTKSSPILDTAADNPILAIDYEVPDNKVKSLSFGSKHSTSSSTSIFGVISVVALMGIFLWRYRSKL